MRLSPDQMIFWQHGFLKLNGTIVFTWGLMLVLAVGSKLITRQLSRSETVPLAEPPGNRRHRYRKTDRRSGPPPPGKVYRLLGTRSCLSPWRPYARSFRLRTADGLTFDHGGSRAVRVVAVPLFGIGNRGWVYLISYTKPTIDHAAVEYHSELSRTLALASACSAHDERDDHASADHHALHSSIVRGAVCSPAWCKPISSASWPRFTSRPHATRKPKPEPAPKLETKTKPTKDIL